MKDVELIIQRVSSTLPTVRWVQVRVKPFTDDADDDGVWRFDWPGGQNVVRIKSADGMCPFVLEHDLSEECYRGDTVEDVYRKVVEWLRPE